MKGRAVKMPEDVGCLDERCKGTGIGEIIE